MGTRLSKLLLYFGLAAAVLAQPGPAPGTCQSTVTGTLEIFPFASNIFGNTRNLRVWLPPGYQESASSGRRYPVLYLLDGQTLFDRCSSPGWTPEWRVDETLTDLIGKHAVEPIIVVGIDNTGIARDHEFAPYPNPLLLPSDPVPTRGDRFPDFLAYEVLPVIAARYRTIPGRDMTGIGGASLGAAAALYALIHQPGLFGLGLLESTSLQLGNGQLIRDTNPILMGPIRISIGVGTEEIDSRVATALGIPNFNSGFVELSQSLAANMKAALFNRPEVKLTVQPGAHHNAQFWSDRFPAAVQFLFPPSNR